VDTRGVGHIEADEKHSLCAPLNSEVESLETRVPTGAGLARFAQQLVVVLVDVDAVDVGEAVQPVLEVADLVTGELGKALPVRPPRPVAAIDNIREGNEVECLLDGYDPAAALQNR
jgi:hypothetical protein